MSGGPRSLPRRPSLRYLKLEAKRRLAVGEFSTLHKAQLAIAWEHGVPSWAALKQIISGQPQQECHALPQLRWVIARFKDAGEPAWTAPGDHELRQHFDDRFLTAIPVGELLASIAGVAAALREELVVMGQAPLEARVQIAGLEVFASVDADPPHRLTALHGYPLGERITDARVAAPQSARTLGDVPADVVGIADEAFAELGLAALVLAGGGPDTPAWVVAKGWADVDRAEVLDTGHRFPAHCATALVTATAVLRLAADGRFALDAPANDHLRTVRLADDTITVRELLSHTAGVDSPTLAELFADSVPDLVTLVGPVVACGGPRGAVLPSNGGYAVLGQLIADVTGLPYTDAVTRLVLDPLGMSGSSFPSRSADIGPDAVTGYNVTPEGTFVPLPARVATVPAIGGLWATAADVVRLGAGWSSLLPRTLASEALTPQTAPEPGGRQVGLCWLLSPRGDVAAHGGAAPGITASLLSRVRDNRVHVTMTNRLIPLDAIDGRVLRSWTNPAPERKEPQS
jgi:CubicO group peptidase (beta-lactamase class C family)